jgi:hypothetical protein
MKQRKTEADMLLEKIDIDLDGHSPDYDVAAKDLERAIRLKKGEYGKEAAPLFDLFLETLGKTRNEQKY